VINRAAEILSELEDHHDRREKRPRVGEVAVQQLPLFSTEPHPVVEEVRQLKIDEMSPLEAISKLYQLQRRADEEQ
jgi:DNA mismatch repair protein MutS